MICCRVNYAKAFSACRRHRIDLNVLVDHNREAFMKNLPTFVEQVKDVDYINLFLTSLGYAFQFTFNISDLNLRQPRVAT